jgi:F0F1-type ATP synthase membrane subunit b/b'
MFYNNDKLRISLLLLLSFCVLSSKNILIYNEETLVALSWFCFLFFVYYYFGANIRDSLNERSEYIQKELQKFVRLQMSSYKEIVKQYQKGSDLVRTLKNIDIFANRECTRLKQHVKKALRYMYISQLQQKFKNLAFSNSQPLQEFQYLNTDTAFSNAFLSFQKAKPKNTGKVQLSAPLQKKLNQKAQRDLASQLKARSL